MDDPQALIRQAEKLLSKGSGVWGLFGDSRDKFEGAAGLFTKAAEAYKRQDQNIEAGKIYERAGKIQEENLKDYFDAAESYVKASNAYRKHNNDEAIRCRVKALEVIKSQMTNTEHRRSRINDALGQICEFDKELELERKIERDEKDLLNTKYSDPKELKKQHDKMRDDHNTIRKQNLDKARNFYYEAYADIRNDSPANANKFLTKYADISALIGHYEDATKAYNDIITTIRNSGVTWNLSKFCIKAIICYLADIDMVATRRQLAHYQEEDKDFSSQYKYKFLADLCDAVEGVDENRFTDMCHQFERTGIPDQWMNEMLHKIREEKFKKVRESVNNLEKQSKNQVENQVENQDENQDESQDHPFA